MKFSIESTTSYNSVHPAYHYNEQFANNIDTYQESTKWFGVFLAFLSGTFFTISSALVKAIRNVDPMLLLIIRAILQILAMVIVAIKTSKNFLGPKGQQMLIHLQVCISPYHVYKRVYYLFINIFYLFLLITLYIINIINK